MGTTFVGVVVDQQVCNLMGTTFVRVGMAGMLCTSTGHLNSGMACKVLAIFQFRGKDAPKASGKSWSFSADLYVCLICEALPDHKA